jgi:aminopeptidase N
MTDRYAALAMLVHAGSQSAEVLLEDFARRHGDNPLVMDKWFAVQAQNPRPETVDRVEALMGHEAFSLKNPNKVRALIGAFAMHNPTGFHRADGAGYRLVGKVVRELDALNPQVASRLVAVFNRWRVYDAARQAAMQAELEAIRDRTDLSPDVEEIVRAALRPAR